MAKSIEQWRAECLASQLRADYLRKQTSRRRTVEHERRIALVVAFWLIVLLLVWWALAAR